MKIKALLTSAVTIALCLCVIAGSTFALFTKSEKVSMSITAGALTVDAIVVEDSARIWSETQQAYVKVDGNKFVNGGSVTLIDKLADNPFNVVVAGMTPGDSFQFDIKVENDGAFAVKNTVNDPVSTLIDEDLMDDEKKNVVRRDLKPALKIEVATKEGSSEIAQAMGSKDKNGNATDVSYFTITVTMAKDSVVIDGEPVDINEFQGAVSKLAFTVTTVQHNG